MTRKFGLTTATTRKTSFENKHLPSCDYFSIVTSFSHSTMLAKHAKTRLAYAPLNQIKEVVFITANLVITRC